MATINKRQAGWQAIVRKKGYPSQTKSFRTKAEAERWSKSVEVEMERGGWQDKKESESTTLCDAFERYAGEVTVTKKTHGPELRRIQQWQARPIARLPLARIGGQELAKAIKEMEAEGKGGNTRRLHLAVLSHLFKVARTEWGMTNLVNPVELVRKPKLPKGRDRRFEDDEEVRLLEACGDSGNTWLLPVVRFAIGTAMRIGEIVETFGKKDPVTGIRPQLSTGLLWEHVDLGKRTAYLPETKNDEARTVPLSSTAVEVLKGILSNSLEGKGKVFDTTYDGIHQAYVRACRRAAIEDLRFHDLRHEATSRLFEKGFNPMEVSTITGHKTLQMLKRYTHLRAEDLAKRMG